MSTDQLNIRIDAELKKAFLERARENGTTATELLVNFMRQYLGLESDRPQTSVDTVAIEQTLQERLDTRIAEMETRLAERLDNRIAEVGQQYLGESLALSEQAESLGQESQQLPDLDAIRDRILGNLKLGKQAPGYKAAIKALDQFIAEVVRIERL